MSVRTNSRRAAEPPNARYCAAWSRTCCLFQAAVSVCSPSRPKPCGLATATRLSVLLMPLITLDLTQLDMHEAAVPLPSLPPWLDVQLSDSPQVVFVAMGVNDAPYAVVVSAAER